MFLLQKEEKENALQPVRVDKNTMGVIKKLALDTTESSIKAS